MKKVIMTKGLPASGKSTWAKEQVDKFGFKRINKDDLRAMIDNGKWSKGNENTVVAIRDLMLVEFLHRGYSVIIDDTNFHDSHQEQIRALALDNDAQFEIKDFSHVSLEECLERDKKRANYVGEEVIKRMYRQYMQTPSPKLVDYNPALPYCIIVDVDGTIANNTGVRGWYDHDDVYKDAAKTEVLDVIEAYCTTKTPIAFIFSGRENTGKCYEETRRWLVDKVWPYYPNFSISCKLATINDDKLLTLRKEGDHRKDAIIKKEMFDEIIKDKYNVLAVFDDRNQVVDMWRSLGLQVFQVAEGNF